MENKSINNFYRGIFYCLGLLILAFGITLNTKVGLGVSPIITVSFCISELGKWNFGNVTFGLYVLFVIMEITLHLLQKRKEASFTLKKALVMDILQLPLCLIFTRVLNLFSAMLPDFAMEYTDSFAGSFPGRILILLFAILCTGIGAALSLNMRLIPNPGDGIVQAMSDFTGKGVGLMKNCLDAGCIIMTIAICLTFAGRIIGIGLGTVLAVIGVGRVMAVFNYFYKNRF